MLIFVFFGAFLSGRYDLTVSLESVSSPTTDDASVYVPEYDWVEGDQLELILVISSTCEASAAPELPRLMERLKVQMASFAENSGIGFRTSAIAADWIPEHGWAFLEPFGAFDEVTIGGNWANYTLVRQIWDHGLVPRTPAIYIQHRGLRLEADSIWLSGAMIISEQIVLHREGVREIGDLANGYTEHYLEAEIQRSLSMIVDEL